MAESFDANAIKPIRWGEVRALPDGRWLSVWIIALEHVNPALLGEVAAEATDVGAGFAPRLALTGPATIRVEIETTRWGMELDYYALTYRLFSLIDAQLGRIQTIQGTPRDWWQPFRTP